MDYYRDTPPKNALGKRIAIATVGLVVVLIYAVVAYRLHQTKDLPQTKVVYFSQAAQAAYSDAFEVHQLTPGRTFSADGLYQMRYITYLPATDELEVTVKYKKTVLVDPSKMDIFDFSLTADDGGAYEIYHRQFFESGRYCYVRLCFSGVKFDFENKTPITLTVLSPSGDRAALLTLFDSYTSAERLKKYTRVDL